MQYNLIQQESIGSSVFSQELTNKWNGLDNQKSYLLRVNTNTFDKINKLTIEESVNPELMHSAFLQSLLPEIRIIG